MVDFQACLSIDLVRVSFGEKGVLEVLIGWRGLFANARQVPRSSVAGVEVVTTDAACVAFDEKLTGFGDVQVVFGFLDSTGHKVGN